jgi:DNA-binding LacI/PurR family transcriptional regulator
VNYLVQDFYDSLLGCLQQGKEQLLKYNKLTLVYSEQDTPHPEEIIEAVRGFCNEHGQAFECVETVRAEQIGKGQAYFVIRDDDLVTVIKNCRRKNFELGSDVGIISYNDTPMKEVVGGGISVISTDFKKMGWQAAEFVKNKQKIGKVLPTSLILRDSL